MKIFVIKWLIEIDKIRHNVGKSGLVNYFLKVYSGKMLLIKVNKNFWEKNPLLRHWGYLANNTTNIKRGSFLAIWGCSLCYWFYLFAIRLFSFIWSFTFCRNYYHFIHSLEIAYRRKMSKFFDFCQKIFRFLIKNFRFLTKISIFD